jgi:hypothetical protein
MLNKNNEEVLVEYIFYFNKQEDQWISRVEYDGILLADLQQPSLDLMIKTLKEYRANLESDNDDNI